MLDPNTWVDDGVYNIADDSSHPAHASNWKTSPKGNLFRTYRGITLTIFRGKKNNPVLCIAGPAKWGQRFIDLGAALNNPQAAINEAIKRTDAVIADDKILLAHEKEVK